MVDIIWLAVIVGGLGCLWMYRWWTKFSRLPPGPKGWPLVGNTFQQDSDRPHLTWSAWADKHGEVYTIHHFSNPVVMCNSSESIREILVSKSNEFAGRPTFFPQRFFSDDSRDVISGDFDPHWAYRKKVLVTSIKMYGDGQERLETIMQDVIKELVEDFQKTNQQPFDPLKLIKLALCNTLSLLLLGDRFDYSDQDFLHLLDYIALIDQVCNPSLQYLLVDACPVLINVPLPFCRQLHTYVNGMVKDWLPRMIQKRKVNYDADNLGCILDAFIKQHETDMKTNSQSPLEMRHVVQLCADIFFAGMLTSSAAIYTMMAILITRPDIQAKVQEEIDQVLGGRRPMLQDKQSMPYFQAVFEEMLRYAVLSISAPHCATEDSSICGHFIPKGTKVWPNVWHLCHDPDIYEDPWTFNPNRFLDDNGDFVPPDHPARKNVMVFGAGRRVCAGEHLARNRIFLIMTSLLQSFTFEPSADDELPECDPHSYQIGITHKPKPYKIRAIPRN